MQVAWLKCFVASLSYLLSKFYSFSLSSDESFGSENPRLFCSSRFSFGSTLATTLEIPENVLEVAPVKETQEIAFDICFKHKNTRLNNICCVLRFNSRRMLVRFLNDSFCTTLPALFSLPTPDQLYFESSPFGISLHTQFLM